MKKIILDTDFLIHSAANKVDIFNELRRICSFNYKVYILDKGIEELNGKKNSGLILEIINGKTEIIKTSMDKDADSLILEINDKDFVVCTNDKDFKEKLKKRGIPVISLRQGKYLVLENVL